MSSGSYEGHNALALLAIVVLGLLAAGILAVYGCTALARRGVSSSSPAVLIRSLAAFTTAAALAIYAWGAVHLMLLDGTRRDEACKRAVGTAHAISIDEYRPAYIPLRLGCHVAGVGTYSVGVPSYINPAVLVLVVLTIVLAIAAALESESRARHVIRKESEIR